MTETDAENFAKQLLVESELVAMTFGGTTGDERFSTRVKTLQSALMVFGILMGMNPPQFLELKSDDRPQWLKKTQSHLT